MPLSRDRESSASRGSGSAPWAIGFSTLDREVQLDDLPVRGRIPLWLSGTLVRNGPARFEVGSQSYRHWFDGLAMLHRFSFEGGRVSYANRFLESNSYLEARERGRISRSEFGTDPCRSIFGRVAALFFPRRTDNALVSIDVIANRCVAMTEAPMPVVFDPRTLRAAGVFQPAGGPRGQLTTAHPHSDLVRNVSFNYHTKLSRKSAYHLFSTDSNGRARILASLDVDQPAYMHSFGMTQRYLVLVEFPLVVNPLDLILAGKPFIENFQWKPERGSRFWLIDKEDGRVAAKAQSEAFFAFHHANAAERGDDVVVDLVAWSDPSIIQTLYLDRLRNGFDSSFGELRRYTLRRGAGDCAFETLSPERFDFPRINYPQVNMRAYRYVFGAGSRLPRNFIDQLVKVNIEDGRARAWFEPGCYPGEPVFIAAPDASREDEGVILSVVLDANTGASFLLVLDAGSFEEVARATVPHHIPFGFHGHYLDQ